MIDADALRQVHARKGNGNLDREEAMKADVTLPKAIQYTYHLPFLEHRVASHLQDTACVVFLANAWQLVV